jgi:uncharacterized glyoxalase superfamily protein PhnB
MFQAAHVIVYSQSADADRDFIRDALGFPFVDAGDGWLIFKLPPAELAIHPADGPPTTTLYFMCEDIDATLDKLVAAGAVISSPVSEQRWGKVAEIGLPSGTTLPLYQPRHPVAYDL